jgi:hypothetical protein
MNFYEKLFLLMSCVCMCCGETVLWGRKFTHTKRRIGRVENNSNNNNSTIITTTPKHLK